MGVERMKIYLAGGTHSGWQDRVKYSAPQHEYFDPRIDADQRYPFKFTQQDYNGVQWCDIVFAYFEKDNPSGLGLAKECAWGMAYGKIIIFIDEHDRLADIVCAMSRRIYSKLEPAIEYLKGLK